MSNLLVQPPTFDMASSETLPLGFDVSNVVGLNDTVSAPTCTLTDVLTNTSYPAGLIGNASVNGNVITQVVTGLVPMHNYRLVVTWVGNTNKDPSVALTISCPF